MLLVLESVSVCGEKDVIHGVFCRYKSSYFLLNYRQTVKFNRLNTVRFG
jgi:hypothetical protein